MTRSVPINVLAPWVTLAGRSLACSSCGAVSRAPMPWQPGYSAALEAWLEEHRRCAPRLEARFLEGRRL